MDDKYLGLSEAIVDGEGDDAVAEVRKLLADGSSPLEIFSECVESTLNELGEQFAKLEVFLPDLMMAGQAVNEIQVELEPLLKDSDNSMQKGKAVICTVYGDLHDIGKNMVKLMMEVNGFKVVDMGVDVPTTAIIKQAEEMDADLVLLSGLMMPSLPFMRETIELVKLNPSLKDKVKVLVGGGPVTQGWADTNGADGYADDAIGAVHKALSLLS